MAYNDFPVRAEVSDSGGGRARYDPNDISAARPVYDPATGQITFQMPDGTSLGSRPAPYYNASNEGGRPSNYNTSQYDSAMRELYGGEDKGFLRDAVNSVGNQVSPGSNPGGGGGGGLPMGLKALAAVPAIARQLGGGNGSGNGNASMPPELQQLLAMAMQRMSQQEPLFQSINAQAMAGLPTAYQR